MSETVSGNQVWLVSSDGQTTKPYYLTHVRTREVLRSPAGPRRWASWESARAAADRLNGLR